MRKIVDNPPSDGLGCVCSRPSLVTVHENVRKFRFPVYSPREIWVLLAQAVNDRPGIVPTLGNRRGHFLVLNRAATPGTAPGRVDNHGAWIPVKHTKLKPARLKMTGTLHSATIPSAGCHAGVTARGLWLVASEPRDTIKTPNLVRSRTSDSSASKPALWVCCVQPT